jgi:cap3/cap4 methyltransferase
MSKRERSTGDVDTQASDAQLAARTQEFFTDGPGPSHFRFDGALPRDMPIGEGDFPQAKYRSRGKEPKTAVHWGQRKLLISEMQLITYFCQPGVKYWIVYVGAAPGSHILFLDDLYDRLHDWELIDPGQWDHRLTAQSNARKNIALRNVFFDNAEAYRLVERRLVKAGCPALSAIYRDIIAVADAAAEERLVGDRVTDGGDAETARTIDIPVKFVQPLRPALSALALLTGVAAERCPMLFVSDVRSGSEKSCKQGELELHVYENMMAQEAWTDICNASFAMLKFRLPYNEVTKYSHELKKNVVTKSPFPPQSLHCAGSMLLPVWTRPTSTECRLVVPANSGKKEYSHGDYEDKMFFFNAVVRERCYFRHGVDGHPWITHHYDGAAEVALLERFVLNRREFSRTTLGASGDVMKDAMRVSESITHAIGSSFERAWDNREKIHIGKGQRAGWSDETTRRLEEARRLRGAPFWRTPLSAANDTARDAYVWSLVPVAPGANE